MFGFKVITETCRIGTPLTINERSGEEAGGNSSSPLKNRTRIGVLSGKQGDWFHFSNSLHNVIPVQAIPIRQDKSFS
jgi:hypothetical protein